MTLTPPRTQPRLAAIFLDEHLDTAVTLDVRSPFQLSVPAPGVLHILGGAEEEYGVYSFRSLEVVGVC